jgi:DNA processing protein
MVTLGIDKNKEVLLHLLLCDGVGVLSINKIIESKVPLSSLYDLSVDDLSAFCFLKREASKKVVDGLKDFNKLQKELALCQKMSISLISIFDAEYPKMLLQINVPPPLLFVRGKLPASMNSVLAVVGSRKADLYSKNCVFRLLPDVIKAGFIIVSGGAAGIDTFAHRVALDNCGSTIVVAGSGLNFCYPESNRKLFDEIVAKGSCILSIFPINTSPSKQTFPIRNRVIAGLANGTLVVAAAKESGSLITAKFALEEGRELMAVPGQINSLLSDGCHELIKQGARLVSSPLDIFKSFEFDSAPLDVGLANYARHDLFIAVSENNRESCLNDPKQLILNALSCCRTTEDLVKILDIVSPDDLVALLFELELEGLIIQHFNGMWEKS